MFKSRLEEQQSIRSIEMENEDSGRKKMQKKQSSQSQRTLEKKSYSQIGNQIDPVELFNQKIQNDQLMQEGRIAKALQNYQEILQTAANLLQIDSLDFKKIYSEILQTLCDEAMKQMSQNQYDSSLDILMTAENITSQPHFEEADTDKKVLVLNNLGCLYKRMNRLQKALQYLDKALKLVEQYDAQQFSGVTYLNLCSVCNLLGLHEKALNYAQDGLNQCSIQLLEVLQDPIKKFNQQLVKEKARQVAISYYNIAAEEDFFKKFQKSMENYKQGFQVLKEHNAGDTLIQKFKQSYINSKNKLIKQQANPRQLPDEDLDLQGSQQHRMLGRPQSATNFKTQQQFFNQDGKRLPKFNQQQFSLAQTPSAGGLKDINPGSFYFKGSKILGKSVNKKETPQIQKQIMMRTMKESNLMQSDSERPATKINNLFGSSKVSFHQNQESDRETVTKNMKSSGIFKMGQDSDLSRLSHDKQMQELEMRGVLKWSDSEASEGEEEYNKQQRMHFLKSLNEFDQQQVIQLQSPLMPSQLELPQVQNPIDTVLNPLQPILLSNQSQQGVDNKSQQVEKKKQKKILSLEEKQELLKNYVPDSKREYDIQVILKIQEAYKRRLRKRKGKDIMETQKLMKEAYLIEKQKKFQQEQERLALEETERKKREEESMEEEQRRLQEEMLEEQRQKEEEERLMMEQLAAEEQERIKQLQNKMNQSAMYIQRAFRKMKAMMNQKIQTRGVRSVQLVKKRQQMYKKSVIKLQRTFKMLLQMKKSKIAIKAKKARPFKFIKRKQLGLREVGTDLFTQGNFKITGFYVITIGTISNYEIDDEASIVIIAKRAKGYGGEKLSGTDIFEENQMQLKLPMILFHRNQKSFQLSEAGCGNLDMKKNKDLLFLLENIEKLLYIQKGWLKIEDVTDNNDFMSNEDGQGSKFLKFEGEQCFMAAAKIQKLVRGKQARNRCGFKKKSKTTIIKKWTLIVMRNPTEENYIEITLFNDQSQHKQFLKGKNKSRGKKMSSLEWNQILAKEYPKIEKDILEEILDIDAQENTIVYTEITQEKVQNFEEKQKENKKIMPEINMKLLIKTQAKIRGYLTRKTCSVMLEKQRLKMQERVGYSKTKSITLSNGKNVQFQKDSKKLITRKQYTLNGNVYVFSLHYDFDLKVITVTCCSISKLLVIEEIPPYSQIMYDEFSKNDLSFYGPLIIEKSYLKPTRKENIKKICVPRIEEIMSNLKIKLKFSLGQDLDFKNPTIEARKILNQKKLRQVFRKHKSVLEVLELEQSGVKVMNSKSGEHFVTQIKKSYRKHQQYRDDHIKKTKNIKEFEDLENYAMSVKPTSKLVEINLESLEERRKAELEGGKLIKHDYSLDGGDEIIKETWGEIANISNKKFVKHEQWNCDVWYMSKFKSVMVVGLSTSETPKIYTVAINISLFHYEEGFVAKVLKTEIPQKIFSRLRFNGKNLIFEEEVVELIKTEVEEVKPLTGLELYMKEVFATDTTSYELQKFTKGDFEFQYMISISNAVISAIIMYIPEPKIKTEVQFMLMQFECKQMNDMVKYKNTNELLKFFQGILTLITEKFVISCDQKVQPYLIKTNQTQINKLLPEILQSVFAQRLQKTMRAQKLRKVFKQSQVFVRTNEYHLQNYQLTIQNNIIVQISFYLLKNQKCIKMTTQKHPLRLNKHNKVTMLIDLEKLKQNMDASAKKGQILDDPPFLTDNNWLSIHEIKPKNFFFQNYKLLFAYLINKMHFKILFDKVFAECKDLRVPIIDDKSKKIQKLLTNLKKTHNNKAAFQFYYLANSLIAMQRAYRRILRDQFFKIKKEIDLQRAKQLRQIGPRIKRAFKVKNEKLYIINIYQKQNVYTFDFIDSQNRREKKKDGKVLKIRGVYEYDPNQLLNTKDKTVAEYILEQINIENNEIIFSPQSYERIKTGEQQDDTPASTQILTKKATLTDTKQDDGVPKNISSNLVDYVQTKDPKTGQHRIYNVVYTGRRPVAKKKQIQQQGENAQIEETNLITINVDLSELKKLYPTVDIKEHGLMKVIGEQLIDGIGLTKDGEVLLDSNKLNPHCLTVEESLIDKQSLQKVESNEEQKQQEKSSQQTDQKSILLKTTKIYSSIKYLIIIYIIERKVNKIVKATQDTVFEEYEIIYQISCLNLTKKSEQPLIWEVTPDEIQDITIGMGLKDELSRARYLINKVQIFNSKFIVLVEKKEYIKKIRPNDNIYVFFEYGLLPIQFHFKNKKYRINYKNYKEEIKSKKDEIIWKGLPDEMQTMKSNYLVICFNKRKLLEFAAWDLNNFQTYRIELEKMNFAKYLNQDKSQMFECIEIMTKYFEVPQENQKENFLQFNEISARDNMDKKLGNGKQYSKNSNQF